jgi:hypothetical protein
VVTATTAGFPDRAAVSKNQKAPIPTPNITAELKICSSLIMTSPQPSDLAEHY